MKEWIMVLAVARFNVISHSSCFHFPSILIQARMLVLEHDILIVILKTFMEELESKIKGIYKIRQTLHTTMEYNQFYFLPHFSDLVVTF